MRKRPPKQFEEEVERLFEDFFANHNGNDEDGKNDFSMEFHKYLIQNLSPVANEFYEFYNKIGDEGQLCDIAGGYVLNSNGDTVQEWQIDKDGYFTDVKGERLYYSDGIPVMAKYMSDELAAFLETDGWCDLTADKRY